MVGSPKDAEEEHRRALAIRERLAAAEPANDDYQRDLAASLSRTREYRRALAIREWLAAAHPDVVQDQIALAQCLSGPVTSEGSFADNKRIVDELRRHGERLEAMVAAYPGVPEIRRSLAWLYSMLAAYQGNEGDLEESLRSLRRSQQVLEGMTNPLTNGDRVLLFRIHQYSGDKLLSLGRRSEVLRSRREAAEHAERLVKDNPAVISSRGFLGEALFRLGDFQRESGLLTEAGESLRRSRAILEDLAKVNTVLASNLDRAYTALGRLEGALGRPAEAVEVLRLAVANCAERIVALPKNQPDPGLSYLVWLFTDACDALIEVRGPIEPLLHARARFERLDREGRLKPLVRQMLPFLDIRIAKSLRQTGRSAEAREVIRRVESELELFRGVGRPSSYPYNLACVYAMLSGLVGRAGAAPSPAEQAEIRAYGDRAMDELRRALDAGFAWMHILRDQDLDALRDRPDFQALVRDLAFPADPFAQ
jgi:tetratricopeptide (TPR) repeat protein